MVKTKIDPATLDLQETLVCIKRVSKTVKGGRIMRFTALMVVGDGNGHVGYGLGKAAEVPDAIRKGIEDAKKNLITVSLKGSTIPHEVIGEYGAGRVLHPVPELSPAVQFVQSSKKQVSRTSEQSAFVLTTPQT